MIDRNHIYNSGNIEFKNYTILSIEEQKLILEFRNDLRVREMMHNNKPIKEKDHFDFIERLNNDTQNFYWAVYKKSKPLGAVYLNHFNLNEAFWGIFINPKYIGTGIGVEIQFETMNLFFQQFNLEKIKGEVLKSNKDSLSIQPKFLFNRINLENQTATLRLELARENWKKLPKSYKEFKRNILLK